MKLNGLKGLWLGRHIALKMSRLEPSIPNPSILSDGENRRQKKLNNAILELTIILITNRNLQL